MLRMAAQGDHLGGVQGSWDVYRTPTWGPLRCKKEGKR
jgi:hypothetical protein